MSNDKIVKFDISYKIKENIILNLLKLYKLFIRLYNNLNTHIQIINEIDIYDKKVLMSDTSKNNINKNKLHILDIYNNFIKHIINNNNKMLNFIIIDIKKILISDTIDIHTYINDIIMIIDIINKYFNKNLEIIDLINPLFNTMLGIDTVLDDHLYIINENNKQFLLEYEFKNEDIKINKKNTMQLIFNKKEKEKQTVKKNPKKSNTKKKGSDENSSKDHILKNNINIVKTYNKFKYQNTYHI